MVTAVRLTRAKIPKVRWQKIAGKVLGKNFDLSVVLVSEGQMARLKRLYPPRGGSHRKKPGRGSATNVLSFALADGVGEIFLCPIFIRKESALFHKTFSAHLVMLYIHGLLHLRGLDHNSPAAAERMAREEEKIFQWQKTLHQP